MPSTQALQDQINLQNLQNLLARSNTFSVEKAGLALSYINTALRNPLKPTRCAKSLHVALTVVVLNYLSLPAEVSSKRDTLRANIYAFLMAKRTDEELKAMMRKMTRCTCKTASDASTFHTQIVQSTSNCVWSDAGGLISAAFGELTLLLNRTDSMPVFKGTSKAWPTCMTDLLPFGAEQLVVNILQWYSLFPDPAVIRFPLHIMNTCGHLVHDAFNKADLINLLFIDQTRKHVDEALACTTPSQLHKATFQFSFQALSFLRYLYFAVGMPNRAATSEGQLMKGAETKAFQLCSMILYILGSPYLDKSPPLDGDLPEVRTDALTLARNIFRRYHMDRTPGPPMPIHPDIVAFYRASNMDEEDVFHEVAIALYSSRFFYTCVAPGCKSCYTDPEAVLRTCSGCSTVRYCCQQCQTTDWKEGPYKHKQLCKIISKIVGQLGTWKLIPIPKGSIDVRSDDINRREEVVHKLKMIVMKMVLFGTLNKESEFPYMLGWAEQQQSANGDDQIPQEWNPGYEDYEDVIRRFENSNLFKAPKAEYIDQVGYIQPADLD